MQGEEAKEPVNRSNFYGFDNSKPAPWQDPNNIKKIRKKYALSEEDTYR